MQEFAKLLPLAFVMVAGPQIISAVMLATSEKARQNSLGYVAGASLATLTATSVFYFVATALHLKARSADSASVAVEWVFVVVLVAAAIRAYLGRSATDPPKWMGKLQGATPAFSFRLGLLLFFLMPTDLMMTFAVGAYAASHDLPLSHTAGFWLLTTLLIASPLLLLLLLGRRADTVLPRMREWMNANSWIVSEIVIAFFLVMEIRAILGA